MPTLWSISASFSCCCSNWTLLSNVCGPALAEMDNPNAPDPYPVHYRCSWAERTHTHHSTRTDAVPSSIVGRIRIDGRTRSRYRRRR